MTEEKERIKLMEERINNVIATTLGEYENQYSYAEILFSLQHVIDEMSKKADLRIEVV
jgi:hypothetical protein